ncbi:MAG TPA: hypothetical protein VJQ47_04210 [Steroidobacteraceae bacterium]|nr:hypothetical protein [Steroidobacteraceae bacterium]
MKTSWRVVVGAEMEQWQDIHGFLLDPLSESWIEAPDNIIPGYKQKLYETEPEANAMARRLRAYGYVSATERAG